MIIRTGLVKMFLLAAGCLALAVAVAGETQPPAPHMMYFYNPTCRLCTGANEVVGAAEAKYKDSLSFQRFNIAEKDEGLANVEYMFALLDEMKVPETENPTLVVFLGMLGQENGETYFTPHRVLVDGEEIIAKLDKEIAEFLAKEGKGGNTLGMLHRPAQFFSSHLALAATIVEDEPETAADSGLRPPSSSNTPGSLRPPSAAEAAPAASSAAQSAPSSASTVSPAGPVAQQAASLRPPIRPRAEGAARPTIRPRPDAETGAARESSRADSRLRFGAISLAALADSVNPCAFATIIILVAMMSSAKRSRGEIIAVCLAFTASVFVTYFAIGLFLHRVISWINSNEGTSYWFRVAADLIYYLAFAICVIFAFLSLFDAYRLFRGMRTEEMTLQLPKAFKKRINVAMAHGVRARWLMLGVFMAGVTVSFLEAACTGQVYLPTIIALAKMGFWESMALLLWYNFLFVVPLLIIFGLVFVGVTSAQLADFFKKNVAWIRVALAVVFIAMGAIIWFEMYWPPGYRG